MRRRAETRRSSRMDCRTLVITFLVWCLVAGMEASPFPESSRPARSADLWCWCGDYPCPCDVAPKYSF
ncbi:hypothetical protein O3P69_016751 [Scylla paramamosain]|uniref:Uncharacterized protein n=1 Tax=Scylla paramamosain TaxID=85552 RepID=A0AAW0T059_SCYPA